MPPLHPPLYLAGPTGSGKTAVALELARLVGPAEIVNADAFQSYRGMAILSASPTQEERILVPHHLFGILDPAEICDAATFAKLAKTEIADIASRALPLVVGGSGLYLKAITHGLAPTPKSDPEIRRELDDHSLENLVERYRLLDPEGASVTNLKNRRYVARNLEICLLTGRPASELKGEWEVNRPDIRAIYLHRERDDLYRRIDRRTLAMFDAGVVAEVSRLGGVSSTAEKAIGLREILSHLRGEVPRETCVERIQQATRQYSKRQETWFKRETAFQRIELPAEEAPATTARRIATLFPQLR